MSSPIICDLKNLSLEDILKRLIRTGADGSPVLNTVVVAAGSDPFVDCDNKNLDLQDLLGRMITIDGDGNWALKVIST